MPTKILLADDSMTAQKMGKEILTAAGYEVVAVSNGAAAAKKLNDKYGVIILDINMPGYTGFELCEKIRANMDIAKTPVLLTIGKMEHHEPTDVQRVKADGVIIKPFEATDLLATVQKLIEKSAPAQPDYEKTMILKREQIQEFKDDSYNEWKQESEPEPAKKTIEMSHADASAPAFGMDMEEHLAPAGTSTPAFEAAAFSAPEPSAPAFEVAAPSLTAVESSNIESLLQPVQSAPAFETAAAPPPPSFASSPGRDPMFEAPANESVQAPAKDPALAAREEMTNEEFLAKSAAPEPVTAGTTDADFEARVAAAMSTGYEDAHEIVEPEPEEIQPEPAAEATPEPVADTASVTSHGLMAEPPDYERTVRMTARPDLIMDLPTAAAAEPEITPDPMIERTYEAPAPAAIADTAPVMEAAPEIEHHDAELVEQLQAAVADMPVEPHFEEVAPSPEPEAAVPAPIETTRQDLELASALAAAVGAEAPSAMVAAASAMPSANVTVADPNVIAAAVHRAMAKMMPAIMSEVAKELDPEKK